ncbi:GSCOCG00002744001-RA-CDS, partial [Cotesia congregata]
MITIAVFFDFSKAFDSVVHKILIFKLKAIGFGDLAVLTRDWFTATIDWIVSYLKDRLQAIRIDNSGISDWKEISSGVPQGSVLGPLLYSIYITDLGVLLKHLFYADDLVVYLTCKPCDIESSVRILNEEIAIILKWCIINGLKLNPNKTKAVIFGSAQKLADVQCEVIPNIVVNDTIVDYCKSVNYRGVILQDTLIWSLQITEVCKSSMRVLAQLKMNGDVFSLFVRERLVTTLIYPIFDYCAAIYTDITGQQQIRLQRKLNACVRYIFKISKYEHVTQYYTELRWLKLSSRRKFFLSCLIYKALYLNQ